MKEDSIIEEGAILYGVSSQNKVIPMVINKIEEVENDNFSFVIVEAYNNSNDLEKRIVSLVFSDLIMINGEIHKERIFTNERKAKDYAIKNLEKDERNLVIELELIRQKKIALSD